MGQLQGRTALLTGAGSGLGKAAAIAFAGEGASVVLCGRRLEKLHEVQKEIQAAGGKCLTIKADVSVESDVKEVVRQALATFGRIDIVVNNAAVFEAGHLHETSLEAWKYQLDVNLTGPFLITRECLPHLIAQNYGRIINVTSGLALNGAGGFAAYSASKAGLESLTRTMADEASGSDILANMYNPGTIRSEMHATGRAPQEAAPDLIKLASLPASSLNGALVEAGALD